MPYYLDARVMMFRLYRVSYVSYICAYLAFLCLASSELPPSNSLSSSWPV